MKPQKARRTCAVFFLLLGAIQGTSAAGDGHRTVPEAHRPWGVEFNVIWPFVPGVGIYTAKGTRTLWSREDQTGEVTFGLLIRPGVDDDENADLFREYGVNLGYRHYFWRKAHLELALYPSWAIEERNYRDGEDHQGFALTTEVYAGYRIDVGTRDHHWSEESDRSGPVWYVMPQSGVGYTVFSDLGPPTVENSVFWTLNLQVGARF